MDQTYTITATLDGKTLTRRVTIAAQGLQRADFRWPSSARPWATS